MYSRILALPLIGLFGLLSGCGYNINSYGVAVENIESIRSATGQKVAVNDFTATKPGVSSITCRAAGPVETPNKESFETYIQRAFIDELKLAGVYDPASTVALRGNLEEVDFNSNIGMGKWMISLTVSSAGKAGYTVQSVHEFSTNWVADKACQQVAQAFVPAVQQLIGQVVRDPRFKELTR